MIKGKLSVLQESNLNSLVKLQITILTYLSISQLQTTIITLLFQPQTTCLISLSSSQHHYLTFSSFSSNLTASPPFSPSSNFTTSIPSSPSTPSSLSSNSTTSTPSSKHSHQLLSAFSLIELSIVIIILGLLAVGVMGGASMIKTSRVNSIMTEYKNIKVAMNSFLLYRSRLPGDVNNDDRIESGVIADGTNISESLYFWRELLEEGLIGDLRYNPPSLDDGSGSNENKNIIVGTTIPSSRYDRNIGWHMLYLNDERTNALVLSGFNEDKMVDAKTSHIVDIKMDDGNPLGGKVYVDNTDNSVNNCFIDNDSGDGDGSGGNGGHGGNGSGGNKKYNDNGDNALCSLIFSDKPLSGIYGDSGGSNSEADEENSDFQNFVYSGSPQEFIVPKGVKKIKIEVWGARGDGGYGKEGYGYGDPTNDYSAWGTGDEIDRGGKGGYSSGILNVEKGEKLYVYVGGTGNTRGGQIGWNGGGGAKGEGYYHGGGGTDVRRTLNNEYQDRIIVAGGGGGAPAFTNDSFKGRKGNADCYGGDGGGEQGGGGDGNWIENICGPGTIKGKDEEGGSGGEGAFVEGGGFGYGSSGWDLVSGGGGGWYGGCANKYGGGGGSGWIGGVENGHMNSGVRKKNDGIARICWGDTIEDVCTGTQFDGE
jgi:hypothetical protein